ncbi:MAG: DUF1648 domain-containing protein [Pyrinomonadaceae bacterium]
MSNLESPDRLSDYTNLVIEVLVATLSIAPFLILAYFYPVLPERIPVFLNMHGEVEVWAAKSLVSVFRVPAMAIDLQLKCLLMKYGTVKSRSDLQLEEYLQFAKRSKTLVARLWDWLRCFVAFKMSAESVDVLFQGDPRLHFLRTPAWVVTWLAATLSIAVALYFGYQSWRVKREMKEAVGLAEARVPQKEMAKAHILAGIFYYDPKDETLFVTRYLFNFGNKLVYVLLACIVAYPLLVFAPL